MNANNYKTVGWFAVRGGVVKLTTAVFAFYSMSSIALAQSPPPSRLLGPVPVQGLPLPPDRDPLIREQFRRRAAETAQKQLEQLAEQLREQLVKEIAARRVAETSLAELTTQTQLSEQIDQARKRLRDDRIAVLEARKTLLERDVADLTRKLSAETEKRRRLEAQLSDKPNGAPDDNGATVKNLSAKVKELEHKLTAAEWARKLAEAQLKLVNERREGR